MPASIVGVARTQPYGDYAALFKTPCLVTNATMLEYMLVRTADAPILRASRSKLQWVVLDEAHTYVGSQAADVALLRNGALLGEPGVVCSRKLLTHPTLLEMVV
jgi:hypothetical protein